VDNPSYSKIRRENLSKLHALIFGLKGLSFSLLEVLNADRLN